MIDQVSNRNRLTTGEGVETTLAARQFATHPFSGVQRRTGGRIPIDVPAVAESTKIRMAALRRPAQMAPGTLRRKEAPHAVLWPSRTTVRLNGDCALAAKENPMAFRHPLRLLPKKCAFAYSGEPANAAMSLIRKLAVQDTGAAHAAND